MHIFLDNSHQGAKYTTQISSHKKKLRIKEKFNDQKSLSITSLRTDYLDLDISSGSGRNDERPNIFRQNTLF